MSIEAEPLDLSEEQAEYILDFYGAAEQRIRGSTALAILIAVSRDTLLRGDCRTTHHEFGRRTGTCRRTICSAIDTLKKHALIERTGTTDNGVAIYRANFDAVFDAGRAAHVVG